MTATLKIKRNVVARNYKELIEAMYKHREEEVRELTERQKPALYAVKS